EAAQTDRASQPASAWSTSPEQVAGRTRSRRDSASHAPAAANVPHQRAALDIYGTREPAIALSRQIGASRWRAPQLFVQRLPEVPRPIAAAAAHAPEGAQAADAQRQAAA